jgi:sugar phosphate isomerase/epimerase
LFPGDGEFPLTALIKALAASGGLNQVGPEVFSPVLADMSAEQVASKSAETIARVLGAAGVQTPGH